MSVMESAPYYDTEEEILADVGGEIDTRLDKFFSQVYSSCTQNTGHSASGAKDVSLNEHIGRADGGLYPNSDTAIWLRTCDEEQITPVEGVVTGEIPVWLKGTLLRNGPGRLRFGPDQYQHLFDGCALLHGFQIADGRVTYRNRFLRSKTYEKNQAAGRIVVDEFGTLAPVLDPCNSIFQRVSSVFRAGEVMSDNAMISIYPISGHYYTFAESPYLHRINPDNLATLRSVNMQEKACIANQASHPHVDEDGTVYCLSQRYTLTGPQYAIVRLPNLQDCAPDLALDRANIVASVRCRWLLHPCYMHSFCMTPHYFVLVEQPLCISVARVLSSLVLRDQVLAASMQWFENEKTRFIVVERSSGRVVSTEYHTRAIFFLHTINAFETDQHLVVDLCGYRNPDMLQCMYVASLKEAQWNADFAEMFRSRPLRFRLPLFKSDIVPSSTTTNTHTTPPENKSTPGDTHESTPGDTHETCDTQNDIAQCTTSDQEQSSKQKHVSSKTKHSSVSSQQGNSSNDYFVPPQLLCDIGCEVPRINYAHHNGKSYRYFYAISSDVDTSCPAQLIKVDTLTGKCLTWSESGMYPSEPVFTSRNNAKYEDDGVILSALLKSDDENVIFLLILAAESMKEVARVEFHCQSAVPKCLHGWFKQETDAHTI